MASSPCSFKVFVVGGFGRQGRGLICALRDLEVQVRTLTRRQRDGSEEHWAGVEILWETDMSVASVELMAEWLQGCQALYLNLDYWSLGAQREQELGKRWVEAGRLARIEHIVYSTLENCTRLSQGEHPFEAFDSKTIVEEFLRESGVPATCVKFATYFENFIEGHTKLHLQVDADGSGFVEFAYPTAGHGVTLVPCHDAGRIIARIFLNRDQFVGRSVGLAAEHLSLSELAVVFQKAVVGVKARWKDLPRDSANNMWKVKQDHEHVFKAYVDDSLAILPDLQSLATWFSAYAHHWQTSPDPL